LEEPAVLFVKSEKIEQTEWTMPQREHACSAGYRAFKTDHVSSEEDRKAIELLKEKG